MTNSSKNGMCPYLIRMEKLETLDKSSEITTWEEESGLLAFLSEIYSEVARFDSTFDFGISTLPSPPKSIDGRTDVLRSIGFVVVRRNSALTGRDYCLYSVLKGKALYGYVGLYSGGDIETVRELKPMVDFKDSVAALLGWLRALVKASCEKI